MTPFDVRPIGYVRCAVRERKQMAPLGVPAAVELLPEFVPGLLRIEKHSHLWVLTWLDRAERDVLEVTPRGVADRSPAGLHGVFAVRSPVRPNPIGLTLARVVRIAGNRIELERLDYLDGTPVVDLKPYFLTRDAVWSAVNEQIGRPASREALREALIMQAVNFHGERCADADLGVRLYEDFRAEALAFTDPRGVRVTAPAARPHLVDALMGMTRATPGRGTLVLGPEDRVSFESGGVARSYDISSAEGP